MEQQTSTSLLTNLLETLVTHVTNQVITVSNHDFEDQMSEAIRNHDFAEAISDGIENADFSDKISEGVKDLNFSVTVN